MPKLGVNIDHVATLRQARKGFDPDPILAARLCEQAGAHSIVCHLREDRRHINENDVRRLRKSVRIQLNLEMSLNPEIVRIAGEIKPDLATIVPERRQELTTEGGLDVVKYFAKTKRAVKSLKQRGITVSLFIAPEKKQVDYALKTGAPIIELHTGKYAEAKTSAARKNELLKIKKMVQFAQHLGLMVSAGHGLKYHNTRPIAQIPGLYELNIGHSIITRSVFVGLRQAVKEMVRIVEP